MTSVLELIDQLTEKYEIEVANKHHSIRSNLEHSRQVLRAVSEKFAASNLSQEPAIEAIAVAGSYARYEASKSSDFDVLVVLNDDKDQEQIHEKILALIQEFGYDRPNPKGVFAKPITVEKLKSVAGATDETYGDLSKRILMLLESVPVYRPDQYDALKSDLIKKYSEDINEEIEEARKESLTDPEISKNFVFLLNDIIRYFRTICVNYQYTKTATEWGKWPIRNIKLRHSRVLMYLSLVCTIGYLSRYRKEDKVQVLHKLIDAEPLRRLYLVYRLSDDDGFFRIAGYYNVFLDSLNTKDVRERLAEIDYKQRYNHRDFAILKANSDALASELLRFIFEKRGVWSDRFFEYLIF